MKKANHQLIIKASYQDRKRSKSLTAPALAELRNEIDILDGDIWFLLSKRFTLMKKVAKIKKKLQLSVHDPKRERAVIAKINASNADPEIASAIGSLYKQLFTISKMYQRSHGKVQLRTADKTRNKK